MKEIIRRLLAARGYVIQPMFQPDIAAEFISIQKQAGPYTMTSKERQHALYAAVQYLEQHEIEGDIVECGVWKGGSTMVTALTLLARKSMDRKLYLYDTFAGMSEPTEKDVNLHGNAAAAKWKSLQGEESNAWDYASLEEVRANVLSTGYPEERITFIKGLVEDTIPGTMPQRIALLRLDTDWYASTKHELKHLFPLLVPGGVLIIDDYGHWQGARQAVDEYFKETGTPMLLNRIDYTGRMGVKIGT